VEENLENAKIVAVTTPIEKQIFGIVTIVKKKSDAQIVIEVCYGVILAAISLPEALATDFWITPATGSSSSGAIGYTIHRETGGTNSEVTAFTTQQETGDTNSEATAFTTRRDTGLDRNFDHVYLFEFQSDKQKINNRFFNIN